MVEGIIGVLSGIVSGFGMGGGTILILILSAFMTIDHHVAQSTNLIFFVPTAIASIIVNIKQKYIDYKMGLVIGIVGTVGAVIGAKISIITNGEKLKKYFAVFLIGIAIYETYSYYKKYKKK